MSFLRQGNPDGRSCRVLAALLFVLVLTPGFAADSFVVRDIRVEGLQRISEGTLFNYLPINVGDELDQQRIQEAMRAVFGTEFFRDVEFRRDGDVLIIAVIERPSIASFTISGNKDIKTEDLEESLAKVGLRTGRILNRSVLEDVERSLTDEYFAQGKYGARVKTEVEELPDNKVDISINIKEGDRARIRQINIVGNRSFDDEDLLDAFKLRTPHWLSWLRQDDRYSREALGGDLESLRSFYMDRGFADFLIESTQVAISPDKRDIFISVNIVEGERYTISDVQLAGDLVVPEEALKPYIQVQPGQMYSQRLLSQSDELIQLRLGEDGYAFAEVEPVTQLDKEAREVSVTFYVDPKNRVYVRRINFNGADSVNQEVFRREMRQFEGGYLSKSRVDRSKVRLQRLPYVEEVSVDTTPVPGTPDMVDVDFQIKEGLPGQFGGGVGFSDSQGILLNGSFVHTNFMGSGNRVAADINIGKYRKIYSASYTNPYVTLNEVSRTVGFAYRDITQFTSDASTFDTQTLSANVQWGYPLSEYQRVFFGFGWQSSELLADSFGSSKQAFQWVGNNGNVSVDVIEPEGRVLATSDFANWDVTVGWTYDTRNRSLFATRGSRHRISASATVPGSEVEFYTLRYDFRQFIPLTRLFTLMINANVGFGDAFGSTTDIPPYQNYFSGGPDSVRGFRESTLGPRDSLGNPYGGNLVTVAQTEVIIPIPKKWQSRTRFSLFFDIGNVYYTGKNTTFYERDGVTPLPDGFYDFSNQDLRQSVGIAAQWLAPLGLFRFSYGIPMNEEEGNAQIFGDETENFQFSIGGAF